MENETRTSFLGSLFSPSSWIDWTHKTIILLGIGLAILIVRANLGYPIRLKIHASLPYELGCEDPEDTISRLGKERVEELIKEVLG